MWRHRSSAAHHLLSFLCPCSCENFSCLFLNIVVMGAGDRGDGRFQRLVKMAKRRGCVYAYEERRTESSHEPPQKKARSADKPRLKVALVFMLFACHVAGAVVGGPMGGPQICAVSFCFCYYLRNHVWKYR